MFLLTEAEIKSLGNANNRKKSLSNNEKINMKLSTNKISYNTDEIDKDNDLELERQKKEKEISDRKKKEEQNKLKDNKPKNKNTLVNKSSLKIKNK